MSTSATQPLVSILTPSLNQGRWLPRNLASVAAQTYPNLEHIVVDGGSTDGSVEILRRARGVRWTSAPDQGQTHALNTAFSASGGDVIGWLNADDAYYTPATVASAVAELARRPEVAVVYGHSVLVGSDDELLHFLWTPRYSRWLLRRYNYIAQPSAFIRRSALGGVFLDEHYDSWMDRELWLRLSESYRFSRIRDVLAVDRHHSARKSYRGDLAEADRRRIAASYGCNTGSMDAISQRVLRVLIRLLGVSLLVSGVNKDALNVEVRGWRGILVRQVAQKRRRMGVDA